MSDKFDVYRIFAQEISSSQRGNNNNNNNLACQLKARIVKPAESR
jgi:hypothetical protein